LPGASAKQPKPDDPGLLYCANNNDGSVGEFCRDADCQRLFGATVHKPRLSN
jgi:hypothetical protein